MYKNIIIIFLLFYIGWTIYQKPIDKTIILKENQNKIIETKNIENKKEEKVILIAYVYISDYTYTFAQPPDYRGFNKLYTLVYNCTLNKSEKYKLDNYPNTICINSLLPPFRVDRSAYSLMEKCTIYYPYSSYGDYNGRFYNSTLKYDAGLQRIKDLQSIGFKIIKAT